MENSDKYEVDNDTRMKLMAGLNEAVGKIDTRTLEGNTPNSLLLAMNQIETVKGGILSAVSYPEFEPHEMRVVIERDNLLLKHDALKKFISDAECFPHVDDEQQTLLRIQEQSMATYLSILNARISLFHERVRREYYVQAGTVEGCDRHEG